MIDVKIMMIAVAIKIKASKSWNMLLFT